MRALALLLLSTLSCFAELKVGDRAPGTRPESMIKGEAVRDFKRGEVYVFECWASWCGPCVATIPHINELHQKMAKKGVVIVGVNVWEAERGEAAAQRARKFVADQGDQMSYRVAIGGKQFVTDWLEAAGVKGIPHAFIVADDKIAWTGHPGEITEELLGDIITGTHEPQANPAASKFTPRKNPAGPDKEVERLQAKLNALAEAMLRKDWDAAEKALPDAASVLPPEERKDLLESVGAQISLARGDPSKMYVIIARMAEEEADDAEVQNEIAWDLVTHSKYLKKPDLNLAAKCAERAVKLSKEAEGDKLDTLARVRWLQGRKEEALKLQEKAVRVANEPVMKVALQKTLDALRQGILPKGENPNEDEK
jgi:thiol-disulfide isomerase/thioredoxin